MGLEVGRAAAPQAIAYQAVQAAPATVEPKKVAAVDVFEAPEDQAPEAGRAETKGFFAKLFAAIGNFFSGLWQMITGRSADSNDDAAPAKGSTQHDTAARVKTAREYTRRRNPTETLRPGAHRRRGVAPNAAAQHIMGKLTEAGLSRNAAAGIAANLFHESAFVANEDRGDNGTAYGLAQWRGSRLTNLRSFTGAQHPTMDQQLEFLMHEMRTEYPKLITDMNNASAAEAARLFERIYERPARHHPERMDTARTYAAAFTGSAVGVS